MIVMEGRDHVRADPMGRQRLGDPRSEAHRGKAGMDLKRYPRPAFAGADHGHALILTDQREGVAQRGRLGDGLEAIFDRVEDRREAGQQPAEITLAAQPRRSRFASVLRRSALSLMKPAAS